LKYKKGLIVIACTLESHLCLDVAETSQVQHSLNSPTSSRHSAPHWSRPEVYLKIHKQPSGPPELPQQD